jgi:glycosyltransferase involved in cell wall biosynthesis
VTHRPHAPSFTHAATPRVLHVVTPSRMAGAETFLARLLRRIDPAHVVTHTVSSRSAANVEMLAAGMKFDTLGIGGKLNLFAVPRLRRAAGEFQADVLHSHLSSASWWCGWLEHFGGPPSIGHVHGFTSARWHSRQTHLIACSEAVKADLIAKDIPADRVTVMHYPVDPDDQRAKRSPVDVRAELGADADTPIVGTFAHLSLKKGYRELVRSAELVLNHIPRAQFWCFGDGPLRNELMQHAKQVGIADRFRLFGFRRDVPDLMRAVDVMCLPSHREPFGLVYVEAALVERPVIACDAGGAPEIINHGETGLLIPPGQNVPALADALLTLLDNRAQAAAMGRRARELAIARFGWPKYLAKLRDLYDCVSSRRTSIPPVCKAA